MPADGQPKIKERRVRRHRWTSLLIKRILWLTGGRCGQEDIDSWDILRHLNWDWRLARTMLLRITVVWLRHLHIFCYLFILIHGWYCDVKKGIIRREAVWVFGVREGFSQPESSPKTPAHSYGENSQAIARSVAGAPALSCMCTWMIS